MTLNEPTISMSVAMSLCAISEEIERVTCFDLEKEYPNINAYRLGNGSYELRSYLIDIAHIPDELWNTHNGDEQIFRAIGSFDFEFIPWWLGEIEDRNLFGEKLTTSQFVEILQNELLERKHQSQLPDKANRAEQALQPYVNDNDWHTAIVDLIADIKIYADRSNIDFKSALKSAKRHAKADQDITDRETLEGLAN